MRLQRFFFWLSGLLAVVAVLVAVSSFSRRGSEPAVAGTPRGASSDTTALVLVTASTNGELSPCG